MDDRVGSPAEVADVSLVAVLPRWRARVLFPEEFAKPATWVRVTQLSLPVRTRSPLLRGLKAFLASPAGRSQRHLAGPLVEYLRFLEGGGVRKWLSVTPEHVRVFVLGWAQFARDGWARRRDASVPRLRSGLRALHGFLEARGLGPATGPLLAVHRVRRSRYRPARTPLERRVAAWCAEMGRGIDRSPATIAEYRRTVLKVAALGESRGLHAWREIGPATLKTYLDGLKGSQATIELRRRTLARFYEYLARRGVAAGPGLAFLRARPERAPRAELPFLPEGLSSPVERFLQFGESTARLSPSTLAARHRVLHSFGVRMAAAGVTRWREVPLAAFGAVISEARASASAACVRSHLRVFAAFLDRTGERPYDFDLLGQGPLLEHKIPRILEVSQVCRLLDSIGAGDPVALRDRALLELAYATAARATELLDLDVSALDLRERTVRFFGKGAKERLVPFGSSAEKAVTKYVEEGRPRLVVDRRVSRLFVNRNGRGLSREDFRRILKRRALAAGIAERVYPHLLRHSCATHLLAGGADLRVVQEILGHASVVTTSIYTHLDSRMMRDAIDCHPRSRSRRGRTRSATQGPGQELAKR